MLAGKGGRGPSRPSGVAGQGLPRAPHRLTHRPPPRLPAPGRVCARSPCHRRPLRPCVCGCLSSAAGGVTCVRSTPWCPWARTRPTALPGLKVPRAQSAVILSQTHVWRGDGNPHRRPLLTGAQRVSLVPTCETDTLVPGKGGGGGASLNREQGPPKDPGFLPLTASLTSARVCRAAGPLLRPSGSALRQGVPRRRSQSFNDAAASASRPQRPPPAPVGKWDPAHRHITPRWQAGRFAPCAPPAPAPHHDADVPTAAWVPPSISTATQGAPGSDPTSQTGKLELLPCPSGPPGPGSGRV